MVLYMKKITIISLMLMTLLIIALVTVIVTRNNPQRPQPHHPTAQRGDRRSELGEFQRVQIEQMLALDESRLAQFRPLYAEYIEATKPHPSERSPFGGVGNMDSMSDEEIEAVIKRSYRKSRQQIKVKEEYYNKFRELLTPREIATIYEVERRTRERLIDEFQSRAERRAGRGQHN